MGWSPLRPKTSATGPPDPANDRSRRPARASCDGGGQGSSQRGPPSGWPDRRGTTGHPRRCCRRGADPRATMGAHADQRVSRFPPFPDRRSASGGRRRGLLHPGPHDLRPGPALPVGRCSRRRGGTSRPRLPRGRARPRPDGCSPRCVPQCGGRHRGHARPTSTGRAGRRSRGPGVSPPGRAPPHRRLGPNSPAGAEHARDPHRDRLTGAGIERHPHLHLGAEAIAHELDAHLDGRGLVGITQSPSGGPAGRLAQPGPAHTDRALHRRDDILGSGGHAGHQGQVAGSVDPAHQRDGHAQAQGTSHTRLEIADGTTFERPHGDGDVGSALLERASVSGLHAFALIGAAAGRPTATDLEVGCDQLCRHRSADPWFTLHEQCSHRIHLPWRPYVGRLRPIFDGRGEREQGQRSRVSPVAGARW